MLKTHEKPHFLTHVLLWSSLAFFLIAFIWSYFAILDETATGEGKVIPSSQIQVIQNLEGGIVHNILVKEGQIVQANQVLMQIDKTQFMSTYNETLKKMAALQATIYRINAEISNQTLVFPAEFEKDNPQLVSSEKALFNSRRQELEHIQQSLTYAEKELSLSQPLVAKGAVSEVEILQLQRTINEIKGKISNFQSEALEELNKAKGELEALEETELADKDKLARTTVRSPVKGIIKQIKVNTIGGVIQPGMNILEIVPFNDTLLIEARIKPADIGFIHLGQKAVVKISAYEYSIYGGLEGTVEEISADTITDERNDLGKPETYYLIRIRTDKNYLGTKAKPLYIIPGMMVTVDILTGHKSVLHYILKPILKAKDRAMHER